MLGRTYDAETCSAARALELVGERWSLLIVRNALFAGATRYNDFLRLGMATNVLKSRLDGFLAAGLMTSRETPAGSGRAEYLLTDSGRELAAVVIALTEWGDRWAAPDGPPVLYAHAPCGGPVTAHVRCEHCGDVADLAELEARPGPGMPEPKAACMRERLAHAAS